MPRLFGRAPFPSALRFLPPPKKNQSGLRHPGKSGAGGKKASIKGGAAKEDVLLLIQCSQPRRVGILLLRSSCEHPAAELQEPFPCTHWRRSPALKSLATLAPRWGFYSRTYESRLLGGPFGNPSNCTRLPLRFYSPSHPLSPFIARTFKSAFQDWVSPRFSVSLADKRLRDQIGGRKENQMHHPACSGSHNCTAHASSQPRRAGVRLRGHIWAAAAPSLQTPGAALSRWAAAPQAEVPGPRQKRAPDKRCRRARCAAKALLLLLLHTVSAHPRAPFGQTAPRRKQALVLQGFLCSPPPRGHRKQS